MHVSVYHHYLVIESNKVENISAKSQQIDESKTESA
jgi:hypothetical protein